LKRHTVLVDCMPRLMGHRSCSIESQFLAV
jgi:hypothetical protein